MIDSTTDFMIQRNSTTCSCAIPNLAPEQLTVDWTVNDVMRCCPSSIVVLSDFGIDTCCGGDVTLDVAARNAGITAAALIDALLPSAACLGPQAPDPTTDAHRS